MPPLWKGIALRGRVALATAGGTPALRCYFGGKRRLGALLCHAVRKAATRMSRGTFFKQILVAPIRPQPLGTGEKISGSSSTIPDCCSGVSSSTP